ncbi:tumor susceptibility gene 101 protein [Lampris incognitus]|uniref:tumor susceptibility gene 101 protein n=1 Tax=Lampris incognitus TaxID=2546036 RepID=UPI0024B62A59|nr:tumor susceptibility gene 101 protein [Lampris incognitus]
MMKSDSLDQLKKMLSKIYLQRKRVIHELDYALTHYTNLVPVMDEHVFNDGTAKRLMSLSGTIPASFHGKIYNIPVCLWLEENYPETAPICYVNPTQEMMFIRGNYITANGEIMLPYLQEWKPIECDLVSLIQVLAAMFGESPPVCMKHHPKHEQASCSQQFQRQMEGRSEADGNSYFFLTRDDDDDDGQPFQWENETNC